MAGEYQDQGKVELSDGHTLEDYYYAQKISFQDVLEHITGPVVSIIVHVIGLALLCTLMIFQPPETKRDLVVEVKEVELKALDKLPEPPPPDETVVDERPDVVNDRTAVVQQGVNVEMNDVNVASASNLEINLPDVLAIKPNSSALKLSGVFGNRGASGRVGAIRQYGGSGATEGSVKKALNWLAGKQNEDGSWGDRDKYQPAFTAMAILAFLAHGETPQSQDYGPVVLRGLKKLIEYSDTIGGGGVIANSGAGYGHAMVAYALSEGYALTKIPMLEKSMNRMIKTIVDGQNSFGSYNYNFGNRLGKIDPKTGKTPGNLPVGAMRGDLSVGGWDFQALKAGFAAGTTAPGLEIAMDRGIQAIKTIHIAKDGGFCYGASKYDNAVGPSMALKAEQSGGDALRSSKDCGWCVISAPKAVAPNGDFEIKVETKGQKSKAKISVDLRYVDADGSPGAIFLRGDGLRVAGKGGEEVFHFKFANSMPRQTAILPYASIFQDEWQDKGSFTMTNVGTLCLQLMGAGKSPEAKEGLKWIEKHNAGGKDGAELAMDWRHLPSPWALYGWYYMTQALFQGHSGTGNVWRKWNSEFTKCLMKEQEREGYWRTPLDKYGKENFGMGESFRSPGINPDTKKPNEPVFSELESQLWATCTCTLMLEVYYRYLPTFKVVGGHGGEGPEDKRKDDDDLSL